MIRTASILGVLGLALACVAASRPAAAGICDIGDAQSFVNAIRVLDRNYVPLPGKPGYRPPSGVPLASLNLPANSPIIADLKSAFQNAPATFRARLCGSAGTPGLNGIFIDVTGCAQNDPSRCTLTPGGGSFNRAWGFRNYTAGTPDFGATYVAIAASDLWQDGGPARLLHDYETQLLKSFRGWSGTTVLPADPDNSAMSVLAALAHEVGHVRWAQTTIPTPGGPPDLSLLIDCPKGDFFAGWRYQDEDDLLPAGRWRPFLNRANASGRNIDHRNPPYLGDLDHPPTANSALFQLYQPGQPWAGLFAAQTPDEDFVESYVMAVLTGYDPIGNRFAGPLRSMAVGIPNAPSAPDVANDLISGRKPALQNKIACVPL